MDESQGQLATGKIEFQSRLLAKKTGRFQMQTSKVLDKFSCFARLGLHQVSKFFVCELFLPRVVAGLRQFIESEHGFHAVR